MKILDRIIFKISPIRILKKSVFFDSEWYKEQYSINEDPFTHYLNEGWKKEYNPSKEFSSKDYLINNPDINDINPLIHYEVFGKYEGRRAYKPIIGDKRNIIGDTVELDYEEIFKTIDNKDVVSFDVFDTLLCRSFIEPDDVFKYIEHKYKIDGFYKERLEAEKQARISLNKEVNIDEIYGFIKEEYKDFKQIEIDTEIKVNHKNCIIEPIYDYAKKHNKRVIAISDMYLPKYVIETLLKNGGYQMDEVYVSCEFDMTKGIGSLYDEVLKLENINSSDIVHFGDNYNSDYYMARQKDIDSYQTPKISDYCFSKEEGNYLNVFLNKCDSLGSSIYASLICDYFGNCQNKNFYKDIAYMIAGPLVMAYLKFVLEKSKELSLDKLLFVSRDGYCLKEIYEKYYKEDIEVKYAYLSRACIYAGFKVNKLVEEDEKVLDILNKSMKVCGVEDKESIDSWSIKQSNNLSNHLSKIAGTSQRIATIDMFSGNYTSQKGASYYIKDRIITGFYAGNFKNSELNHYSYSENLLGMRDNLAVKLSELLISSYENSIIGVNEDGSPIYEETNENNRVERYNQFLSGICNYYDDYLKYYGLFDDNQLFIEEWLLLCDAYFKNISDSELNNYSVLIDSQNPTTSKNDMSFVDLIDNYIKKGY